MNLENTKIYTKDPEVIRKYAELCGKKFECAMTSSIGVYNCDTYKKINDFMMGSPVDIDNDFKQLTTDQINALHDEKFGKVETPEEAEAFDIMAQDNEQLQNHEMGERVEWKSGDECVYDGSDYVFVGMTPTFSDVSCIIFDSKNGIEHVSINKLRKPETPQQREERERNEWAQNVIGEMMDATGLDFTQDGDVQVVKAMYDLGYRKQKDGE